MSSVLFVIYTTVNVYNKVFFSPTSCKIAIFIKNIVCYKAKFVVLQRNCVSESEC